MGKVKKFFALSGEEKKLFVEAYVTLGLMRAALLVFSFKHLTHSLEHQKNISDIKPLSDQNRQSAMAVGKAIIRAAAYTPWESACLVQSLTAQRMLQKRGIPGVFYLGVLKDNGSEEKINAHAWSQCGDMIITGGKGHEAFTVLSVFRWGKE
ncbi:lasso peptide biosynthesis B2 protein [Sulfurovum sp. zt1-1]|uniref:Lasso peptide biosynthesis B2 protein n=1 Tax=Sulfurovum zhangzhouensis TaxID=3019067 RepID=A0ABT7QXT4_9BACT|nr:lasso peptide biosynthesis B2 protein [Sulfurovum zhangzhouensis]MDM5271359.1 lasso peptide biosynthesis B2 protein [Sulfurovum zhangzhouensis]